MSHGSHALSVAGVRDLQQVFGHFGPWIPGHGRSGRGSFSSDACRATRGLALELPSFPSVRGPTLLSGASPRFSPGPHHASLRAPTALRHFCDTPRASIVPGGSLHIHEFVSVGGLSIGGLSIRWLVLHNLFYPQIIRVFHGVFWITGSFPHTAFTRAFTWRGWRV